MAAGAAVLSYLNQHGVVVASTHDPELNRLLAAIFDSYHFSEVLDGNQARFDYQLRKGPCTKRDAIRLLALAGYPLEIVAQAERLSAGE